MTTPWNLADEGDAKIYADLARRCLAACWPGSASADSSGGGLLPAQPSPRKWGRSAKIQRSCPPERPRESAAEAPRRGKGRTAIRPHIELGTSYPIAFFARPFPITLPVATSLFNRAARG